MSDAKSLALLIPGLDGTGMLYYRQVEALSHHFRVLPIEFHEPSGFDCQDLVAQLREATAGEPQGSVTVIGESFGGTIAMQYALSCPDMVQRLLLINTFPYYPGRIRIRLGLLLEPLLRFAVFRVIKDWIVEGMLRKEGIPIADREEYKRIIAKVNRAAYRRRLQLVRDVDLRQQLRGIRAPTVIFASGRDKIVPSTQTSRLMASLIPHAMVHEFPQAGHALLLTPGFSLADYGGKGNIQISDTKRGGPMQGLSGEKCEACRIGAPKVAKAEMKELLPQIPDWRVAEHEGILRLERSFAFPDFARALAFTLHVGELAEKQGHHPAILTEWGRVKVEWWTHKIGGLHRNDFIMAAKTDEAFAGRSNPT